MARESDELVEMRRVLGGQLAAFRQAAGLSQGRLAKATFCDRTSLAHIEKGRSRGDERFWTLADERCSAEGVLLAGFRAWESARQDHEVRAREALLAEARAKAEVLRAAAAPQPLPETMTGRPEPIAGGAPTGDSTLAQGFAGSPGFLGVAGSLAGKGNEEVVGQLVTLFCGWVGGMNRRELIELLGWATGTVATSSGVGALDINEQERLVRAIVSPDRVDERVIDHLAAMHQFCKHQEDTLGSRAVLSTVLAQRHLVSGFLADCPATLRPRLLSVSSDMSTSIGWYFLELNDVDSAWDYYDKARAAAHEADNTELAIHALCYMSYAASWQGKAHTGIDLAVAAQSLASKTDDPLLRARVADKAARAYATDGQYTACMVECERAQDGLASAGQVPAESPSYWFNEGVLACDKSDYLLRLGKPREAVASASAGLALIDNSFVGGLAFCAIFLGKAYLESGEIDEAARVVGNAVSPISQIRSERLVQELRTTRARMQPWQDTPAVKALDEQLAAHGLASSSAT
ncbi:MAG: helix-turn-helix transcriptional regulator [Pseudonocardiaceae bacterium]